MGVDEFRSELATIKSSYDADLIPDKKIFEKMCIEAQRRNLSNLASLSSDRPPLNLVSLKRLLWPVFLTISFVVIVLTLFIGFLYKSLSDEMKLSSVPGIKSFSTNNSTVLNNMRSNMEGFINNSSGASVAGATGGLLASFDEQSNVPNAKNAGSRSGGSGTGSDSGGGGAGGGNSGSRSGSNGRGGGGVTEPLYYLSTSDGVLSHFFQLQHLWSITHSINRTLLPASFHSPHHHHDVQWINLCDIFDLPSDIDCSHYNIQNNQTEIKPENKRSSSENQTTDMKYSAIKGPGNLLPSKDPNLRSDKDEMDIFQSAFGHLEPSQIVKTHACTLLGIHSWALDPKMYHLPSTKTAEKNFNFMDGDCVAGYVDDKSGFTIPHSTKKNIENNMNNDNKNDNKNSMNNINNNNTLISSFPFIKFKTKYIDMMIQAKKSLGLQKNENFTVVHWVDDESAKRQKDKISPPDQRLNKDGIFASHHDFISNVQDSLNDNQKKNIIYVATGDRSPTFLSDLTEAGFTHYADLNLTSYNSLDSCVLELLLMLESSHQIFWGNSLFKSFSDLFNSQKLENNRKSQKNEKNLAQRYLTDV